MKKMVLLISTILFVGCAPSSLTEYRTEGEGQIKKLVYELSQIKTCAQLEGKQIKLKKRFASLADLMMTAKKFQTKNSDENQEIMSHQLEVSNALKRELIRIYQIEGCADKLEEIERDTLHRLDLYDKRKSYVTGNLN